VLPAKLTDAQAQQAITPLLQLVSKTADTYELRTPAEWLKLLAAKVTHAQAQLQADVPPVLNGLTP